MPRSPLTLLQKLEATRLEFGPGRATVKITLLTKLERSQLPTAEAILRLHEHLCFLRAYPDNAALFSQVVGMLKRFSQRADLHRYRADLADTGICGTVIHYPFFWPTARWIVERWPKLFYIDWSNVENHQSLAAAISLVVPPLESVWLRGLQPDLREALRILRGSRITDAVFFVRRVETMPGNDLTREAFFDALDTPFLLLPTRSTPSRTLACYERSPIVFREAAPERSRPDLLVELARPPRSMRIVSAREGQRLIDLARASMVTRERDLDNFAYGDARDVRVVDDGHGLQWAVIGTLPARRPILRATYGMLTLRNGVPIGYVGVDTLFKCADLSYNTFQTFRGGEAAFVFGRTLAAITWLFGSRSFTLEPYQLGHRNEEGIESGAWWFYYKLGFRPRNSGVARLVRRELQRMKIRPKLSLIQKNASEARGGLPLLRKSGCAGPLLAAPRRIRCNNCTIPRKSRRRGSGNCRALMLGKYQTFAQCSTNTPYRSSGSCRVGTLVAHRFDAARNRALEPGRTHQSSESDLIQVQPA